MYCAKCGKEFDNDSAFCPFCGQKVGEPVVNKRNFSFSTPFHVSVKKLVPMVAAFVVLLVIIGKVLYSGSSDYERALKAYEKYANSMDREASYYLTDMDHDSVPECLVWDYAGNGGLDHARVLGYKKHKLVEVFQSLGSGTVSSSNYIQDGTIFWNLGDDYFVIYSNRQTWFGDLLKEDSCWEYIYKISSSGFDEYHTITKKKDNNAINWTYLVDLAGASESMVMSIYSEVYADYYYQSKTPTRYVSIKEAIEDYEGGI